MIYMPYILAFSIYNTDLMGHFDIIDQKEVVKTDVRSAPHSLAFAIGEFDSRSPSFYCGNVKNEVMEGLRVLPFRKFAAKPTRA